MYSSNIVINYNDCVQKLYKYYFANFYHSDIGNAMREVGNIIGNYLDSERTAYHVIS